MEISVKIISASRRRYIACKVGYGGVLEIFLPPGKGVADAELFVRKNSRKLSEFMEKAPPGPRYKFSEGECFPFLGKELRLRFSRRLRLIDDAAGEILTPAAPAVEIQNSIADLYRQKAPAVLAEKCRFFGTPFGLLPKKVTVGDTSSRWGCCYSSGAVAFCWKILLLPEELADYVVCHELAHLQHLDHSRNFWQLTEKICPGALEKRKKLRRQPELWPPPYMEDADQSLLSMRI